MGKLSCLFFGHKWKRGSLKSLKHSVIQPDIMFCLSCKATKEAPATPYTPMDLPPPTPVRKKQSND